MPIGEVEHDRRRLVQDLAFRRDQGRYPAGRVDLQIGRRALLALDGIDLAQLVGKLQLFQGDLDRQADRQGAAIEPIHALPPLPSPARPLG